MPNFNARIRPADVKADGNVNIKIRVSHRGESRFIATEILLNRIFSIIKPDVFEVLTR